MGGALGLVLGGAILTIYEVAEFGWDLVGYALGKPKKVASEKGGETGSNNNSIRKKERRISQTVKENGNDDITRF